MSRLAAWAVLLAIMLAGCGPSPAAPPSATLPPATATPYPNSELIELTPNAMLIDLHGYRSICGSPFKISTYDPTSGWSEASYPPTGKAARSYIDGKLVKGVWCDVMSCVPIAAADRPFAVSRTAYQYLGERTFALPKAVQSIPDYRSIQLGGTIRIELTYFADDRCSQPQTFAATLDLPS
jgi:hypothetical protein